MRTTGEIFWLLACGAAPKFRGPAILLPAFIRVLTQTGKVESRIQLQQRNCLRISRSSFAPIVIYDSQRTEPRFEAARVFSRKAILSNGKFFSSRAGIRD